MGNNIAGQAVTLQVGDANAHAATTDEQGRAQFDGLTAGATVQATTIVDGETLTSQEFSVPRRRRARGADCRHRRSGREGESRGRGRRAKKPARQGVVEIGPESRIILEYQDDNLTVFYLLEVVNNARTPIDIGGPLLISSCRPAPSGASMMQGSSPQPARRRRHA